MYNIVKADISDREEIMQLYDEQKGREFCAWEESYPSYETIDYDLSRDCLFVMKERGRIIAAISIDKDDKVEELKCWNRDLFPGGELSRVAVSPSMQNKGIARRMMEHGIRVLRERGYKSCHFLVNRDNLKAVRSYSYLNFDSVGECFLYDQHFLCYEKALQLLE
ncbi:MAG: GNAT family N-acetyltransferase [Lachnospiraceae bacterium]|nr:GNAT family N-acetyltransferase [Lachnospiraceae bacterium]